MKSGTFPLSLSMCACFYRMSCSRFQGGHWSQLWDTVGTILCTCMYCMISAWSICVNVLFQFEWKQAFILVRVCYISFECTVSITYCAVSIKQHWVNWVVKVWTREKNEKAYKMQDVQRCYNALSHLFLVNAWQNAVK